MLIKQYAQQVPWALQIVYRERPYQVAAVLLGILAAAGFSWATQLVSYFPGSGLFWDITPLRLIQVLTLAGGLGLLVPMQIYVLRKGKQSATIPPDMLTTPRSREASSSRLRSFVPGFSGGLGACLASPASPVALLCSSQRCWYCSEHREA
jgi:asparagine N-glycosylation enzyme membrane subunit Stt3